MRKITTAIILFIILTGCSNNNADNQDGISENAEPQEVKAISKSNAVIQKEEPVQSEVEPFWETYTGEELLEAVEKGEKQYDYEVEGPLFEEALIEYISSDEKNDDWIHYITSFSSNLVEQAPDGYDFEIYKVAMALSSGNKDEALEHVEKAKEIREESE